MIDDREGIERRIERNTKIVFNDLIVTVERAANDDLELNYSKCPSEPKIFQDFGLFSIFGQFASFGHIRTFEHVEHDVCRMRTSHRALDGIIIIPATNHTQFMMSLVSRVPTYITTPSINANMSVLSFPNLVPDEQDDAKTFLPSFVDLRRKNLESLYGSGDDKSPKGSVDVAIQGLVDLINFHPSYVTLSSCSGRIAIFDPKESTDGDERTSKGQGEWIFVSHELVEPASIPPLLSSSSKNNASTGKLIFKHEPLLLHIGACTVARGRQLLSLALQLGFRESGLVVTPSKVTVAIRSHSLALCVPLAYSGALRPPNDYIIALTEEANERMNSNIEKLRRLQHEIKTQLFRTSSNCSDELASPKHVQARFQKLPALNLWGHDAVTVPSKEGGASIYVFGGYGSGPSAEASEKKKVGRSNKIYSLRKHSNGSMSNHWKEKEQMGLAPGHEEQIETTWFGVDVSPTTFATTEGLRVCLLPLDDIDGDESTPTIMIWGGRSAPTCAFGDLLLYQPKLKGDHIVKPVDVRGDLPTPRWGHTLTSLSGKGGLMAVLVGGRDENGTSADNVHVLMLIEETGKRFFVWRSICASIPPQFFHSVVPMGNDRIFVVGGLANPNDLVGNFSDSYSVFGTLGSYKKRKSVIKPAAYSVFDVSSDAVTEAKVPCLEDFVSHYGCGSCCVTMDGDDAGQQVISFVGGLPLCRRKSQTLTNLGDAAEPMRWYTLDSNSRLLSNYEVHYDPGDLEEVNFGAMTYHCCVSLPDAPEVAILGGGVSSFAFGPSFAE